MSSSLEEDFDEYQSKCKTALEEAATETLERQEQKQDKLEWYDNVRLQAPQNKNRVYIKL